MGVAFYDNSMRIYYHYHYHNKFTKAIVTELLAKIIETREFLYFVIFKKIVNKLLLLTNLKEFILHITEIQWRS